MTSKSDPKEKLSFPNSEAVEVLRDMKVTMMLNDYERSALTAAIASLSAPKPESAEAVFNCPACPVSVQSRWQEPECPECGERCYLDPTAVPTPPRPEASAPDATAVGVEGLVQRLAGALAMYDQNRTTMQSLAGSVGDFLHCYHSLAKQPVADATSLAVDEAALFRAADALCGEWNMHYPDAVRMTKTVLTTLLAGQSLKNESDQEQQGGES